MNAGVDFRVVIGALRDAEQLVKFGQQACQCATIAQYANHARGLRFHQTARKFLPDPLGHQMIHLAVGHHAAHQGQGFRGNGEIGKTGRKAGNAQDAYRVFDKGRADMTQYTIFQVGLTVERIDQRAIVSASHGVDGEIPSRKVVFERHLRCGVKAESGVTVTTFALGTGQRVFLVGLRMQENGKIPPDRLETARAHRRRRAADNNVIPILDRQAKQFVTNSAPHDVTAGRGKIGEFPARLPQPLSRAHGRSSPFVPAARGPMVPRRDLID